MNKNDKAKKVFIGVVNATPTPEGYARSLCAIIRDGTEPANVNWAIGEVVNFVKAAAELNPQAWGTGKPEPPVIYCPDGMVKHPTPADCKTCGEADCKTYKGYFIKGVLKVC